MYIPKEYKQSGIYCILNTKTGKKYIGSSNNILQRIRTHYSELNNNKHDNSYLQRSFNKHGIDYFIWGIVEFCYETKCIEREQCYLDNCPNWNLLYNNRKIAESNKGIKRKSPSIETREKTSKSQKKYLENIGGKPLNFKDYQQKSWDNAKVEIFEFDINKKLINYYSSIKEAEEKTGIYRETIASSSLRKGFCRLTQTYFRRQNEI